LFTLKLNLPFVGLCSPDFIQMHQASHNRPPVDLQKLSIKRGLDTVYCQPTWAYVNLYRCIFSGNTYKSLYNV